jgi:hypothetical protein
VRLQSSAAAFRPRLPNTRRVCRPGSKLQHHWSGARDLKRRPLAPHPHPRCGRHAGRTKAGESLIIFGLKVGGRSNRIFRGIPNFADSTDRWRMLGKSTDGATYYLDVRTAELPPRDSAHLWIRTAGKKQTQNLAFEIDCSAKQLRVNSDVVYDSSGKLVDSSESSGDWQRIIPDTIGEQVYHGACSNIAN